MALKRINKELTDLGRYVPDFGGHLAAISSQPEINAGTQHTARARRTNEESVVIPLHHAQQDLSAMIWYVHLSGNRAEAADALRLLCPACSYMSPGLNANARFCGIVSLASNDNGTCTLSLIAAIAACFRDIALFFVRGHMVRMGSCMLTSKHRVTAHTREAFSS